MLAAATMIAQMLYALWDTVWALEKMLKSFWKVVCARALFPCAPHLPRLRQAVRRAEGLAPALRTGT